MATPDVVPIPLCDCGRELTDIVEIGRTAFQHYVWDGERFEIRELDMADVETLGYQCSWCGRALTKDAVDWFLDQPTDEEESDGDA